MEKEVEVSNKMSVTVKTDAKGKIYGEYMARGETREDLKENLRAAKEEFIRHVW